ncbi:uncharacterized protein LOC120284338 [Drosophila simulans]|uniref:uncharacterized protein LOC120284338 n=1 Tax=Drosophila simulans TaxID=7240 RepID=UPI00192CF5A4|nr:uncharacterized protein LOC120284338 [Drosophila simulans]
MHPSSSSCSNTNVNVLPMFRQPPSIAFFSVAHLHDILVSKIIFFQFKFDFPSSHKITIFCPRAGDKTTKWIMELIKKQNDLDTENWRLITRKNEGGGSLLSLCIDDNSCAKTISSDHKLNFRFGDISVCGLKKAKSIKFGTRQVETPRNPLVSAEKEKPNKLFESSEDLADNADLDATIIEMGDQTPISSQELDMELDLLSKEEAMPADGDLGISRSATPTT